MFYCVLREYNVETLLLVLSPVMTGSHLGPRCVKYGHSYYANLCIKISSYIANYPILFSELLKAFYLPGRPVQTASQLFMEGFSHMLQLISYLSIATHSVIQLSELEQYRVKRTCPRI